jgi:hypothetical protein
LQVFINYRRGFLHAPWCDTDGRGVRPIRVPNEYVDLPIDEDGELSRTIIVKLHGGAADLGPGVRALRDNFVITEDDYIGYTQSSAESLIPLQFLSKLRDSHFLFLGYRVQDWCPRAFLQRVWAISNSRRARGRSIRSPTTSNAGLWEHLGVTVIDEPPRDILHRLAVDLERLSPAPAQR